MSAPLEAASEPGVSHPVAIVARTNGAINGDPVAYFRQDEGARV